MLGPSKNTKQNYIDGIRRWQNSNLRNVMWYEWSSKSLNQMERGLRNMYDYSEVLKLLKKFPSLEKLATPPSFTISSGQGLQGGLNQRIKTVKDSIEEFKISKQKQKIHLFVLDSINKLIKKYEPKSIMMFNKNMSSIKRNTSNIIGTGEEIKKMKIIINKYQPIVSKISGGGLNNLGSFKWTMAMLTEGRDGNGSYNVSNRAINKLKTELNYFLNKK
jgi:hypothetical protein